MMLRLTLLMLLIAVTGFVCGDDDDDEFDTNIQLKALWDDLEQYLMREDDVGYPVTSEEDAFEEMRKIIADHGFDSDVLMSDFRNILGGLIGFVHSGDGTRYAAMNFCYQLACYQGRTGSIYDKIKWTLKTYNGYGCYCGSGFYNQNYVDATDLCCKYHDECYTRAMKKYKLEFGCHTYTTSYSVSCCKEKKYTKCTDTGPSAGRALCECDQAMSKCVAKGNALDTYNHTYMKNRSKCKGPKNTKPVDFMKILKTCKHAFKSRVKLAQNIRSQGKCPKRKGKGWLWGK